MDGRALAGRRLHPQPAAGLLDEAEHLAETQAGALPDILGGEEGLEGPGPDLRRHAGSGVADRDRHILPGRRFLGVPGQSECDVAGGDADRAAALHGVARIKHEVDHGELDLGRIGHGEPGFPSRAGVQAGIQADAAAHGGAQQPDHVLDERVHVQRPGVEPLAAGEGEELRGQQGAALGGQPDRFEPPCEEGGRQARGSGLALQQPQVAEDDGQQVVEIVRHAGGELAQRLGTLHLPERGFQPVALLDLFLQTPVGL